MTLRGILLILFVAFGATDHVNAQNADSHYTRNIAWITPVKKNTTINGIAFSPILSTRLFYNGVEPELTVNGLNIELSALGLYAMMAGVYAFVYSVNPFKKNVDDEYKEPIADTAIRSRMNGVSIGLGGFQMNRASGLVINGTISAQDISNGASLSLIMNGHYKFNGLMFAFSNTAATGSGLQVGVINKCREGRVVQIGLLNRIGKRVTPFVNFSFRRKRTHG